MSEVLGVIVGVLVAALLMVVPLVALILGWLALGRARKALERVGELEERLAALAEVRSRAAVGASLAPVSLEAGRRAGASGAAEPRAEDAEGALGTLPGADPARPPLRAPDLAAAQPRAAAPSAEAGAAPPAEPVPATVPERAAARARDQEPDEAVTQRSPALRAAARPTPASAGPPPDPAAESPSEGPRSMEERIGLTWFTRIGVGLVLVGLAFFFKYMVDNEWIGAWGRVALGAGAGLAALAFAELLRLRGQAHALFVQSVVGLGLSLLLLSAYASFAFYALVPFSIAFGVIALLSLLGGLLALRHRSEIILLLSLLAALANPVLLSTGTDRPLGLFAYLLICTSGAFVVARLRDFVWTPWVAALGTLVLSIGWYLRFFDAGPAEAYSGLSARTVPLVFALLFPAQWGAFASLGRGSLRPAAGLGLLLLGLLAGQGATFALLHDQAVLAAAAQLLFIVGGGLVLHGQGQARFVALPAFFAGLLLFILAPPAAAGERWLLLGIATLALGGGLLLSLRAARAEDGRITGAGQVRLAIPGLWLTAMFLRCLAEQPLAAAALVTAVSLGYGLLALRLGGAGLALGALVAGGLALLQVLGGSEAFVPALLAPVVAWSLGHLACAAWPLLTAPPEEALGRGASASGAQIALLPLGSLGFGALLLAGTPAEAELLRAVMALGAGALQLVLGLLLRAGGKAAAAESDAAGEEPAASPPSPGRRASEDASSLALGLALAWFTWAVALLFSGGTVTVIWAAEAAALAYVAARTRHPLWLLACAALFLLGLGHLGTVDLQWAGAQRRLFESSLGTSGTFLPPPFLHPAALGLLALGLAAVASARWLKRGGEGPGRAPAALALFILGHLGLLVLLVRELGRWSLDLPLGPPAGGVAAEFDDWLRQARDTLASQSTRQAMVATVCMGTYAAGLLAAGFGLRNRISRLAGLVLFGVTLGKLAFFDVWSLERLLQIIVLVTVGLLLLAGGFLYARFGRRLIDNLLGGPTALVLGIVALTCALRPGLAQAELDPRAYSHAAPLEGLAGPGDYLVPLPAEVYGFSLARRGLADLRVQGPDGEEVAYLVRPAFEDPPAPLRQRTTVIATSSAADGSLSATFDLGAQEQRHSAIVLRVEPAVSFLRRAQLEGSPDGRSFERLSDGDYLFRVLGRGFASEGLRLRYPSSAARYLRLVLAPGEQERPLRISGADVELAGTAVPAPEEALERQRVPLEVVEELREAGSSVLRCAPYPGALPLRRLAFDVEDAAFVRRLTVEASQAGRIWRSVGGGLLYRIPQAGGEGTARELLDLSLDTGGLRTLRLRLDNGDDPPLRVRRVWLHYRPEDLVLRVRQAGPHRLLLGRAGASAPRYDLGEIAARGGLGALARAHLGTFGPNRDAAPQAARAAEREPPWTERNAGWLRGALLVVLLLLGGWTAFLLRRAGR